MKRQPTSKGFQKRIDDLGLAQVADPRVAEKVKFSLPTLLTTLVASMVTQARSLRGVERRSEQITAKHNGLFGIVGRIADNTFGRLLPRINIDCLMGSIHRLTKAEHRRGTLKPKYFPEGVIAIDGKNTGTLHWQDLCRVLEVEQSASSDEIKRLLTERYPQAQLCVPEKGQPYALMRVHTVTLVSSEPAPCIHMRPISGDTNEIGSMPALLQELNNAYGRTKLYKWITTDAGNTSLKAATVTKKICCEYFAQIKSNHGSLYQEAERTLDSENEKDANATYSDKQKGALVTYHAWQVDLGESGCLEWKHARQLVRIQRVTEHSVTEKKTIGNRYYVCSQTTKQTSAKMTLALSRIHWRCENETHWTADFEFLDDRRKLAWSRNPQGILVVAVLRMIAIAILATARRLGRMENSKDKLSWAQVAEHFLLLWCGTTLLMQDFDNV